MLKNVLFQAHWFLGITAGLILALMGATGALYSFQAEITQVFNPHTLQTSASRSSVMPMGDLMQRLQTSAEDRTVRSIRIELADRLPSTLVTVNAEGRQTQRQNFHPSTGEVFAEAPSHGRVKAFFSLMLNLHRFLAMGDTGRLITGACTLVLLVSCITGVYLRWPRRGRDWRVWLLMDGSRKGRAFQWDLHAVAGTWGLVVLLFLALTGLWWSYDWYRSGMVRLLGGEQQTAEVVVPSPGEGATIDYDGIWDNLQTIAGPDMQTVLLHWPMKPGEPVRGVYRLRDAAHPGAYNEAKFNPYTGQMLTLELYADKPLGQKLLSSMYSLHVGDFFGMTGRIIVTVVSLLLPLLLVTGIWLYLDRRGKRKQARLARRAVAASGDMHAGEGWLIGFASQSGTAEQLAWRTAGQLQAAGHAVTVLPLGKLQNAALTQARQALFIVSTFGEGEPPDSARGFDRRLPATGMDLSSLRYAVLALGDRQYPQFCGFGRRMDAWLASCGAQSLFTLVEVDSGDTQALLAWQQQLGALTGIAPAWEPQLVPFAPCRLVERHELNPGSSGAPVFRVSLVPESALEWRAGDVLEVEVPVAADGESGAAAMVTRDYSIASLPSDGRLDLIVRQARRDDGSHGLGSGWLTARVPVQGWVQARVRHNPGFHLPDDDRPLVLVGNGTGIAGLRSLLRARVAAGHRRNWLLFGERNARCDFFCPEEIEAWRTQGWLQRFDVAFSRDQAHKVYVQDRLREAAEDLRRWLAEGASIYVCGSLQGMAGGVDAVLRETLGEDAVLTLIDQERYRRDVY